MFKEPKNPAEYEFAYIFPHTQRTIDQLNRLSLPFDPYMVTAGGLYVISGDVDYVPLKQIAPIVLSVKDKQVLKCVVSPDLRIMLIGERDACLPAAEMAQERGYAEVVAVLIKAGVAHVPADVDTLRVLLEEMADEEMELLAQLQSHGVIREGTVLNTKINKIPHYWDVAMRMSRNIRTLRDQLKATESTKEDAMAVLAVKMYLETKRK